jgi:hypothetical protein
MVCWKFVRGLEINEKDRKTGWDSDNNEFKLVDAESLELISIPNF